MTRKQIGAVLVLAAFAAQVAALYIATQPGRPITPRFAGEDKVLHFAGFALLALLLVIAALVMGRGYWYFAGMFSGFLLGAVTEILQIWVRGRTASILDWLMNFLGWLLVMGGYEFVRKWRAGGLIHREVT